MDPDGYSGLYGDASFANYSSGEYGDTNINPTWLAGLNVGLGLFSWEVQDNLSWLYLNRIQGRLFWRGTLYNVKNRANNNGLAGLTAEGHDLGGGFRLLDSVVFSLEADLIGHYLDFDFRTALKIPNCMDNKSGNEVSLGFTWALNL
jgi:hypothetical protein